MKIRTLVTAALALALGFAAVASAQTETNHLWPTFDVAVGSYQVTSSDKIRVVEVTRARIVDAQNNFKLLQHFTFSSDKQKVQALLK